MTEVEQLRNFAIAAVIIFLAMALIAKDTYIRTFAPVVLRRKEWRRRMDYRGRHWR